MAMYLKRLTAHWLLGLEAALHVIPGLWSQLHDLLHRVFNLSCMFKYAPESVTNVFPMPETDPE